MEVWPATLPGPERGYSYAYRSGLANNDEDINPARTRTYPERDATFTIICRTAQQYDDFRTFYYTTLNNGTRFFSADWPALIGLTHHRLRFREKPFTIRHLSVQVREIKMSLEIVAVVPFVDGSPAIWTCEAP